MFSERKVQIRIAELLALIGSACSVCVVVAVALGRVSPGRVESLLVPIMLVGFVVFAAAVVLFHEFGRVLHGKPGVFQEVELSLAEMRLLLRWCPAMLKLAFVAAAFILAYTLISIGAVEWSFGQPFTEREARGFPLFMSVVMLVALPVLASASRMPGSFADHFALRSARENAA